MAKKKEEFEEEVKDIKVEDPEEVVKEEEKGAPAEYYKDFV